ncbi:BglG family transcription antiterminator [Aerococcus loyolae]|uniref:PRD domain-containing protein n=1 Tax=Aerococcus loyolae TaxID=2976809 RepID=A0ABT4BYD4_9LACT|nr:PRD domain-containing protein [Aerococcus loyolae]MCY3025273.1 PRD domain-containing protein [Aerococcus loyolae]MCY3027062.1 PRD domain-containing protein [Aerococcus loyolae]MCY3028645.1 PRD domain-containing protein [Aerococcus loyolae]
MTDKSMFSEIYNQLSSKEIDLIFTIIDYAEKKLNITFQSHIYLALADHIKFALERKQEGIVINNPLSWSIRRLYPKEYNVGVRILEKINRTLQVDLDKSEAGSIALHLINAQKDNHFIENTVQVIELVQDCVNIIRFYYQKDLDEESIDYQRLLVHLQYFAGRVLQNDLEKNEQNVFIFEQVKENYPDAYNCSNLINKYIKNKFSFEMGNEEQAYLIIHIQRLVR